MPKKQVSQDRKARIAEMQRQEKARENRVRIQIIAGAAALLLVLGAAISFAVSSRCSLANQHGSMAMASSIR